MGLGEGQELELQRKETPGLGLKKELHPSVSLSGPPPQGTEPVVPAVIPPAYPPPESLPTFFPSPTYLGQREI